jgi:hypothetical protein
MIERRYQEIVSHINYLILELESLKSKILLEEGIHFNVISDEDFIIELWDTEILEPRILTYTPNQNPLGDKVNHIAECVNALNTLGIRAFKKQIYWNSDIPWEDLPENFRKLDQVYNITKRQITDTLRDIVRERTKCFM